MSEVRGNILDDDKVVHALQQSQQTAQNIAIRLEEAETTFREVKRGRDIYTPVALRGASLYFVISDLSNIDVMYQYSLDYFVQVFIDTIQKTTRRNHAGVEDRVQSLVASTTKSLFENVSRGLFEKHKLVFSFLIAIEILQKERQGFDLEVRLVTTPDKTDSKASLHASIHIYGKQNSNTG